MMKRAKGQSGFTLIEVMVALTVTALMLTAVYQTVSSAAIARERFAVENARHHMARIVTERIGRELQSLHFVASDKLTRFRGGITGSDMELLSFTSTASTPLARQPGLPARISYRLERVTENGDDTFRLNRFENGLLALDNGRAYKLADDLNELEINFLRSGRWTDRWDSQAEESLPEAVALTIKTGPKENETVFRTAWQIEDF